MAQSTSNLENLAVFKTYIDERDNFDELADPVDVPVGYDGSSIILHLPNKLDIAIDVDDVINLIKNGKHLYYRTSLTL